MEVQSIRVPILLTRSDSKPNMNKWLYHDNVCGEITFPYLNFNGTAVFGNR